MPLHTFRPFHIQQVSISLVVVAFFAMILSSAALVAQTPAPKPAPKPAAKPATQPRAGTQKPAPAKPAAPAPAPVAAPAPPPPPPAPQDVRFKTTYTTGDQKTETVTFVKGARERFEFQDMVLLKQHDEKRTIQISRAANTYLVTPEGMPAAPPAAGAPAKAPGVVMVSTTIVDTGERKPLFGQQARHVKTMIDKQPMPGACDATKQRIETDGWYIDAPQALTAQAQTDLAGGAAAGACLDQITASQNGDPKALGFPVGYTTTIIGGDGKPSVVSMEVTEFEVTTLDQALFEIPQGLNAAINPRELSKALSDANEAKLVAADSAPTPAPVARTPGVVRIGVPEFTNKTDQTVDTRGLRSRLITELIVAKFDAVPMAAAPQPELQKRAAELGYDYLLTAEVAELKVSKPGALGGMLRAASRVAAPTTEAPKDITEASVAVKLIQADGKQRLSTNTKGKDGSAFTMQTGLGLARFAGTMYMTMMMGPAMMNQLNGLGGANLGGMGMLGSPELFRMQTGGLGGALAGGMGVDGTAGAASYLIQQAMAMNSAGGLVGMPGQGPSFDASLGEALDGAVKAVVKSLQPK